MATIHVNFYHLTFMEDCCFTKSEITMANHCPSPPLRFESHLCRAAHPPLRFESQLWGIKLWSSSTITTGTLYIAIIMLKNEVISIKYNPLWQLMWFNFLCHNRVFLTTTHNRFCQSVGTNIQLYFQANPVLFSNRSANYWKSLIKLLYSANKFAMNHSLFIVKLLNINL